MSPERYQKIRRMLDMRQIDLTVCMEQVHKTHNLSAVLRSCDAVGIHYAHAVWDEKNYLAGGAAAGSQNWVRVKPQDNIQDAVSEFKQQGMQVLVTNLSDSAVDFREIDYTKPTAILLGQEKYGATDEAIAAADQDIIIPMVGMVQSLNVSVAAALVLYEAQRQRQLAGMYQQKLLPEEECQRILFEGSYPKYREMCERKGLPYPAIDENGQINASDDWWAKMQRTDETLVDLDKAE